MAWIVILSKHANLESRYLYIIYFNFNLNFKLFHLIVIDKVDLKYLIVGIPFLHPGFSRALVPHVNVRKIGKAVSNVGGRLDSRLFLALLSSENFTRNLAITF